MHEALKDLVGKIKVGVVLGSGLNALVDLLDERIEIPYTDIEGFLESRVKGHDGKLIVGKVNGDYVLMMSGRYHFYEGYTMAEITYPIKFMKELGVETLILTNACGGINLDYNPGDIVLVNDYINFNLNPLIGPNDDLLGPRFPDMSEPYNLELIEKVKARASKLGINLQEGVYAFFVGPCYETKAEIRALKVMGADLVGMSTVPETIMANYLGMKVLAFATVTNMATGIQKCKHSHERVVQVANEASKKLSLIIEDLLKNKEY